MPKDRHVEDSVQSVAKRGPKKKGSIPNVLWNCSAAIVGIIFVVPVLWAVLASVDSSPTLAVRIPRSLSGTNYKGILKQPDLVDGFINSVYLSGGTMVLTSIVASLAAYPLSRYALRKFKGPFMYSVIFSTGLPVIALLVPVYSMFVALEFIDSILWTTLFLTATEIPFAIWLMKNFMDKIPKELEEAAWIDGASVFGSFTRIVWPLMIPGAAVVAMYNFVEAWGNFFVPFILLQSEKAPAAVNLYQFFGGEQGLTDYGGLAAYSILYSIPVVALYFIMSRWVGGGFGRAGAMKG